jgi:hypothetical protein
MGLPANYYNFFEICKLEEIPTGSAKRAIGGGGLDGIAGIVKLQPIAHLFRSFPNGERKQYGILIRHYDYWKQKGVPPKVSPGAPKKYENKVKNYRIAAPPFDSILEAGLKKMNDGRIRRITKQELIWLFMKEGMERRPQFFDWDDKNGKE